MTNKLTRLLYQDCLEELATFEKLLNGSAKLYFGEIDHDKMITGDRENDRSYLDTPYKHLCALSAYHFKLAKDWASIGDYIGAIKALGEAKGHRMAAMAEYCGEVDLKEQETNRQKSNAKRPRTGPLQCLINGIVANNKDITEAGLLDELYKRKDARDVIQDIDGEEISFLGKDGKTLKEAKISGLKDRLNRAKKK